MRSSTSLSRRRSFLSVCFRRSKLLHTKLTELDVKIFMNLTKFGSSHEKFDVWPEPKSLIERPSPSPSPSPSQEHKVDYLAAYAYSHGIFRLKLLLEISTGKCDGYCCKQWIHQQCFSSSTLWIITKGPYKRMQHCWPTTPKIVGC